MAGQRGGPNRAFPRVAIDAFVRVLGGDREYVFRTRDLSQGGLFLYTRVGHLYPFKIGAALSVELYDFDRAVDFKAVGLGFAGIGARRREILGERAVDVAAAEQRLALGERPLGRRRRFARGRDGPRFGGRRPGRPRRDRRRARGSRVTAAAVVIVVL